MSGEKIKVKVVKKPFWNDDGQAWEDGAYGQSLEHAVAVSAAEDKDLDDALGLQPVSIRLQKSLVKDLKTLAAAEGIRYQTYIRQLLTKHVAVQKAMPI